MKFSNKPLTAVNTAEIVLHRGSEEIPLRVSSQSPGLIQKFIEEIPILKMPKGEEEYVRKNGKPVKDPVTGKILTRIKQTPELKEAQRLYGNRHAAISISDALRGSPGFTFDAVAPSGSDLKEWEDYLDAIHAEISDPDGGFTGAEMSKIWAVSEALECRIDVDEEIERFLSHRGL